MLRVPASLLLLAATGCTWFTQEEGVLITSSPAGARVFVDGTDMHATTPTLLRIGGSFGRDHELTLKKTGYRDAQRHLTQCTEGYSSRWIDATAAEQDPPFPFQWTMGDLLVPFGVRSAVVPHEVYVKLYREGEPLLGFELLQAQRQAAGGGDKQ